MRTFGVVAIALAGGVLLLAALGARGQPREEASEALRDRAAEIYAEDCQSCHGPKGEGVSGIGPQTGVERLQRAGPALTDVGPGTTDFYLSTGYMPLDDARDEPRRTEPDYTEKEIAALVSYVTSFGGPGGEPIPEPRPEAGRIAEGQEIFTDKCAGCHQIVGEGGVVLDGVAPELREATRTEIAEAVRAGPYLMPAFGKRDIDDGEMDSLVRYIAYTRDPEDPGGWGIGHIGPIPEGLAAWLVAALGLVGVARVIGKRMEGP